MALYTITIAVDGVFEFTDAQGNDVRSIYLVNGDRVKWVLDPSISVRTFQIEFSNINPFELGAPVVLRGTGSIVSPPVNFPLAYPGSSQLNYAVALGTGWKDTGASCTVVPEPPIEPPGKLIFTLRASKAAAAASNTFNISWTDDSHTAISLSPEVLTVPYSSATNIATVTWQWAPGQPVPQPFKLAFDVDDTFPSKWPKVVVSGMATSITLNLPVCPQHQTLPIVETFEISTTQPDGVTPVDDVPGKLTVTDPG